MCRPSSWVNDPYPTGRATGQVLAFCEISKCVNATPEGIREVLKCPLGAEKFFKFKLTQTLRQPVKLRMSLHYAEIPMVTDNYINLVQFNLSRVFRVTWYHFSIVPTGNEVRIWRDWKKKKKKKLSGSPSFSGAAGRMPIFWRFVNTLCNFKNALRHLNWCCQVRHEIVRASHDWHVD